MTLRIIYAIWSSRLSPSTSPRAVHSSKAHFQPCQLSWLRQLPNFFWLAATRAMGLSKTNIRAMKSIWRTIVNAFTQTRDLVVIGYSLPGTDAASIEAFKFFAASRKSTNPKRIQIIDPNPSIAERYRSIIGVEAKVICSDFYQFQPSKLA